MLENGISKKANQWLAAALIHSGSHNFEPDRLAKVIGFDLKTADGIVVQLKLAGFIETEKGSRVHLTVKGLAIARVMKLVQ